MSNLAPIIPRWVPWEAPCLFSGPVVEWKIEAAWLNNSKFPYALIAVCGDKRPQTHTGHKEEG
jgi:hypothetical protein